MIKLCFDELLEKPVWYIFLISWLFYLLGLLLFSQFVWDTQTYIYSYEGENFEKFIKGVRRIDLVRYTLSPVWILFLASASWLPIKMGSVFIKMNLDNKLLFKIVLLGLLFISLTFWVKSIWLILIKGSYTPDEVKVFSPFSLISLMDVGEIDPKIAKVISKNDLFHFGLILFMSWMISIKSVLNYWKSFLLVFLSYGLCFLFLQAIKIVMFI